MSMTDDLPQLADDTMPLQHWAVRVASCYMEVGVQLRTRDGRRCGNATVTEITEHADLGPIAAVVTDAGKSMRLTEGELKELFHEPMYQPLPAVLRTKGRGVSAMPNAREIRREISHLFRALYCIEPGAVLTINSGLSVTMISEEIDRAVARFCYVESPDELSACREEELAFVGCLHSVSTSCTLAMAHGSANGNPQHKPEPAL